MGGHPRFANRPVNPDMAEGLSLIWAHMGEHWPDELTAFEAHHPDMRLNMERMRLPVIAGLSRHKKHREAWIQLSAHGLVSDALSAGVSQYCKARCAGEAASVALRSKIDACFALAERLRPSGRPFDDPKSGELHRSFAMAQELRPPLLVRAERVMALSADLSAGAFAMALAEIDQDLALEEGEA